MSNKYKISLFVIASALAMSAYVAIYFYQFGRGVLAEWWLLNVTQKKEQIAQSHKDNRLLIVSGSNGLFGFNSNVVSKETGYDVINMAMHAGLDLSYYRMIIEDNVRRGDIVVMPLEFSYYSREDAYTGWFVDNIIAWGDFYLRWETLWKKVEFFSHTSLSKVVSGLVAPVKQNYDSLDKVLAFTNTDGKYYGYSYKSLNNRGDLNRFNFVTDLVKDLTHNQDKWKIVLSYGKDNEKITEHTIDELIKIKRIVEERGARLYVSWPTTMQTKYFNDTDSEAVRMTREVKKQLSEIGISTLCNPFYANLPQRYFLDTYYHLNGDGAKIRSDKFSQCIKQELK
ncbi:hypothetical protein [Enterobacter kobei]|uniref:hypothetical protein n=1 Tax=Enterobacter kobei TaxID=208224 RepID=UPI000903E2D9|nr:hypothetical protein [Enterobacter kobei]OJH30269.1 hypothetical protein P717_00310 [Enterobacter kobei]